MSAIARILLAKGIPVSGSDIKESTTTEDLIKLGATVLIGHGPENITDDIGEVIISTAIYPDNAELVRAREAGVTILHRSEKLAQIMCGMESIAVAGAHGKTTTTGMAALMLTGVGLDPFVLVGGDMQELAGNARVGKSNYLVTEADESDGTFLRLFPKMAIVTNIENDHLDHYGTVDKIISAFRTFLRQIPDDGLAILCADDAQLMMMRSEVSAKTLTFGLTKEADIYADKIVYSGTNSKCDVYVHREKVCTLELSIPGVHNITNALAVLALAYYLEQDLQQAAEALKYFKGVNRRFQIHFSDQEYVVVDDYAHHPTEIRATLKATKNASAKRVVAVFQPHRFTRTKQLYKDFGKAFADADVIIVTEIYSAGEKPIAGVSARLIVDEIEKTGKRVIYVPIFDTVHEHILTITKPGDMIITIGAGNIWQAGVQVAQRLENR